MEKVINGLKFTKAMITFNPSTGENIAPENLNEADKTTYDACVGAIAMLKEQQQEIWELQDQEEYLADKLKEQEATIEILVKDITFHSCNNCNRKDCESKPNAGQPVRSNCIYWLESR